MTERIRRERARVDAQVRATRDRLEAARPRSQVVDTAFRALDRDQATGGGVLSAAVAFRVFLVLVPFVFFVVYVFGIAADATSQSAGALASKAGVAGLVASALSSAGNSSTTSRWVIIAVSGFALFLAARAMVKVLRITHGLIWRVPVPKLRSSTRAAGALLGLVSVGMVSGAVNDQLRSHGVVLAALGVLLSAVVPAGLWLLASWWLPHADCPWWALVPGAVVCAVGTLLLQIATVTFFAYEVEKKSSTYGAIGVSLALLLWAYFFGRILTASATVNASFWYRSREREGVAVPAEFDLEERLAEGPTPDPGVSTPPTAPPARGG
jgi:uncharacterized BrkB/YihY/UPF0761 family membrane protein